MATNTSSSESRDQRDVRKSTSSSSESQSQLSVRKRWRAVAIVFGLVAYFGLGGVYAYQKASKSAWEIAAATTKQKIAEARLVESETELKKARKTLELVSTELTVVPTPLVAGRYTSQGQVFAIDQVGARLTVTDPNGVERKGALEATSLINTGFVDEKDRPLYAIRFPGSDVLIFSNLTAWALKSE